MALKYQKVSPAEIEPLYDVICECGKDMAQRFGLNHWFPPYQIETMRENAAKRNVHAVYDDDQLIGTFTTGTEGWKYTHELWADRNCKALYLGKLGILPSRQNSGIGTWCVQQVEQQALQSGCRAVRFDAITAHTLLIGFYH